MVVSQATQQQIIENNIEYKYIIGNPLALEKGVRYLDTDLNRSFDFKKKYDKTNYETERAKFLVKKFGIDSSETCEIAIDLHTTTANMGSSIVLYGRRF